MKLLQHEEKILSAGDDAVVLTTHRIQMTERFWGQSNTTIIFLEDISSIELKYKSYLLFVVLAVAAALGGFYIAGEREDGKAAVMGLIAGGVFLIAWLLSRQHVISIASDGGSKLAFMVKGMSKDKVNGFIETLMETKNN